jgi:polyribonucleotide nucleotidyltransferase
MVHKLSCKIGDEELVLETGRMAKQANGAVFATCGGTAVIATACCSAEAKEGLDFVPLTVEYNEKFYAAGKIPGGFIKRETRPKDREILVRASSTGPCGLCSTSPSDASFRSFRPASPSTAWCLRT